MRLAKATDEVLPMRDPRVQSNPAYATVIILARTIVRLGALDEVTPAIVEDMYSADFNYLHKFYRIINELEGKNDKNPEEKENSLTKENHQD